MKLTEKSYKIIVGLIKKELEKELCKKDGLHRVTYKNSVKSLYDAWEELDTN